MDLERLLQDPSNGFEGQELRRVGGLHDLDVGQHGLHDDAKHVQEAESLVQGVGLDLM